MGEVIFILTQVCEHRVESVCVGVDLGGDLHINSGL